MEQWKDIEGFEGFYRVSNTGKVCNVKSGKILKGSLDRDGYLLVSLWKDNKAHTRSIHRLVAIHFIPNPENKQTVNHIDTVKTNNHMKNLEWTTRYENNKHAGKKGLLFATTPEQRDQIRKEYFAGGTSYKKLSYKYEVSEPTIARIIKDPDFYD